MRPHAGKLLILAIFAIGLGSAAGSVVYRQAQTWQVLQYYSGEGAAMLTARGSTASLARRAEGKVVEHDVTKAPGFHNARNALTLDRSYDWETPPPGDIDDWTYLLSLRKGDQRLVLLFNAACDQVTLLHVEGFASKPAGLERSVAIPSLAKGLRPLFAEQFEPVKP